MSIANVASWLKVVDLLERDAGSIDLLTVDVFDTLLMRASTPDLVLRIVAERLSARYGVPAARILASRNSAIRRLEATRIVKGLEAETLFTDVVAEAFRMLGVSIDAEEALAVEEEVESALLVPNRPFAAFLRRMVDRGVSVVALTDMYLPEASIRRLLEKGGISGSVPEIMVSGEYGVSKREGGLYDACLRARSVVPGRWIHVGDNANADGVMADAKGARAVVCLPGAVVRHRVRSSALEAAAERCPVAAARLVAYASQFEDVVNGTDSTRTVGRDRLGPVTTAFALACGRSARADGLDRLWFLAREGFHLKWTYDLVHSHLPCDQVVPSGYLLASRASLFPASSDIYGTGELAASILNSDMPTTANLLKATGVDRGEIASLAADHGIASIDLPVDHVRDPRLHALLRDARLRKSVARLHAEALSGFAAYARKAGIRDGDRIGVVDVGWSGQIQSYLESALRRAEISCGVSGYYVATTPAAAMRAAGGMDIRGLVAEAADDDLISKSIFLSVPVLEDSCRAPHPSVEGYDQAGVPRLRDPTVASRLREAEGDARIAVLQTGMRRHAILAGVLLPVAPQGFVEAMRDEARRCLAGLMRTPSRSEASVFFGIPHVLNFSDDPVITHEAAGSGGILRPLAALRHIRNSRWKEAVAGRHFGPLGQVMIAARRGRADRTALDLPLPRSRGSSPGAVRAKTEAATCGIEGEARAESLRLAGSWVDDGRVPVPTRRIWLDVVSSVYAAAAERPTGSVPSAVGIDRKVEFSTLLEMLRRDSRTRWIRRPLRRLIDAAGI